MAVRALGIESQVLILKLQTKVLAKLRSNNSMSLASYKKRGIVYVTGSTKDEHAPASENLGREIALAGYSLMTGGGRGVALAVGRGFCSVPRVERKGASIGVVWGAVGGYTIPGYPNEFVEVTAQLNLPSNKIGEHKGE